MPLNTVLHERRRELGLTQEQIAEYLGVSTPAVNKWEKGITYPDITLVPSLARLLKVDLNTLLCFQEALTEKDIIYFQEEVVKEIENNGMGAGFILAEKRIQEYPSCGALLEGMANLMQGSMLMLMSEISEENREKYQLQIAKWYERAMDCDDEAVKNRVGFMIVSQHLRNEEYEKAQQILEQLPEPNVLNRDIFQADIFWKQGNLMEAAKLLQKNLLRHVNDILGILWRLTDIELENGKEDIAREVAQKAKEAADTFDMWGYQGLIGFQSIAMKTKNVEESLSILEQMLVATEKPWEVNQSSLYHYLYPESKANISIRAKVLPPLLKMLENTSEYDYLRSHKEFQELIGKYRKKVEHEY